MPSWAGPIQKWDEIMESGDTWFYLHNNPGMSVPNDPKMIHMNNDTTLPVIGMKGTPGRKKSHQQPFKKDNMVNHKTVRGWLGSDVFMVELNSTAVALIDGKLDMGIVILKKGQIRYIPWGEYVEWGLYVLGWTKAGGWGGSTNRRCSKIFKNPSYQEVSSRIPVKALNEMLIATATEELLASAA